MSAGLKLIGAAILVLSAGAGGLVIASSYKGRTRELSQWVVALNILLTEVGYAGSRLPEALRQSARSCLGCPSAVLSRTADLVESGTDAGLAVKAAMAEARAESCLIDSDLDAIVALGMALGLSDREDQVRHITLAIERCKNREAQAESVSSRNSRMWSAMGFLLGGMLAIALI